MEKEDLPPIPSMALSGNSNSALVIKPTTNSVLSFNKARRRTSNEKATG